VLISVLCATRLRPRPLARSIRSLLQMKGGTTALEFLLAVDEDDPTDYGPFEHLGPVLVFEQRHGYAGMHHYYNALAERAWGDWLLLWNDDALMATPLWDEVVTSYELDVIVSPHTVHDPLCTFPFVPARFVEAVGHFSLNAHNDSWWQEIGELLEILKWPDIRVEHRRADVTGENNDSVYRERVYQTEEFNALRAQREADAAKIRDLLLARAA
jgi:hypothetical protein